MSTGYFGSNRQMLYLDSLHRSLITASHILHNHSVFDAYGHISVRNPDSPEKTFFLPYNNPPALLSSEDDIGEWKIEDGEAVEQKDGKKGYLERYIHSEIYKKFPGVNSVVHSHCADVLAYCVTGVPLRPTVHMAGFLGSETPVWDISSHYGSSDKSHDLLVRTPQLGYSLASAFKPSTSASFIYSKMKAALPSQLTGSHHQEEQAEAPSHVVVLQRGHGFTTLAASIEEVVFQAIYSRQAASVQTNAFNLRSAYFGANASLEGKVDVGSGESAGSGKIKSGKVKYDGEVKFLSEREAGDAAEMNTATVMRPWSLWCREVEVNPLYRNDVAVKMEGED